MKAIIITSQRTGSTFLRHCLNSHPEVTCDGEILIGGQIRPPHILKNRRLPAKIYRYIKAGAWNPVKIMEDFLARNDSQVVAFKAMYNHLTNPKMREFLKRHTNIRIIHLRRDNVLKQYVSKMLLGKKREKGWQPHSTEKLAPVSTQISPAAAINHMNKAHEQFEQFERLILQHPRLELVYEDMIDGGCLSNQAMKAVCSLLDLEPRPMCCDYVKVNPNKLELMIDNYGELVTALRGTKFERFLD
jgi:hypothetical protein